MLNCAPASKGNVSKAVYLFFVKTRVVYSSRFNGCGRCVNSHRHGYSAFTKYTEP